MSLLLEAGHWTWQYYHMHSTSILTQTASEIVVAAHAKKTRPKPRSYAMWSIYDAIAIEKRILARGVLAREVKISRNLHVSTLTGFPGRRLAVVRESRTALPPVVFKANIFATAWLEIAKRLERT